MVLLRRVIGDALRARRQAQHRTLREVSTAANVSLGYLSEVERGQKEASSELLASICDALGAQLSDVLREITHTVELAETDGVLAPVRGPRASAETPAVHRIPGTRKMTATRALREDDAVRTGRDASVTVPPVADGEVSVTVRRDSPLKTTLLATRTRGAGRDAIRPGAPGREREVVHAA
jgi:transcriptional regulator with XRE-family HTH domain